MVAYGVLNPHLHPFPHDFADKGVLYVLGGVLAK